MYPPLNLFRNSVWRRDAFTLLELLVVVGMIGMMTCLTLPAMSSLNRGWSMNRALYDVPMLVEQARAYAMSHNTYVWIGFYNDSANQRLTVGAIAGTTGAAADINSASTYHPIGKIQNYPHVSVQQIDAMAGMTPGEDISNSKIGSFIVKTGAAPVTFEQVIQFDATGKASIDSSSIYHSIQVGIKTSSGAAADSKDIAAVQVAGMSGQVSIYRP
jgi:Tfp pilus assembly protein FimT